MKRVRRRVRDHDRPPVRNVVARTTEEELRKRPGQRTPELASIVGNRAMSRMIQSGSPTKAKAKANADANATIQRYDFEGTHWNLTNGVTRSGDGANGVIFFVDGSQTPLVTKASKDPPRETTFATMFMNKLGGGRKISAPKTRLASQDERGQIAAQVEEKAMWQRGMVEDDVTAIRGGQPHVWVMGMAKGKAFGSKREMGKGFTASPLGGSTTVQLFEDPDYARRMGFVTACDLFLGNGDRMDVGNLGNWMTDEQGAIELIDNFSSESYQSLNQRAQGSWEATFMPDLKPSGYLQKGESTYNAIAGQVAPEVKEALGKSFGMSPEARKKAFAKNFAKGMTEARKVILAKLAPTFGKRSRSMKDTVSEGEGGAQAWAILKRRALLYKNLK